MALQAHHVAKFIQGCFMFSFFLAAMLLGFVFNATPGAVFSETLRRGLRDGYKPALMVQIGSLVGDATWAAVGLTGLALLLDSAQIRYPLTLKGRLDHGQSRLDIEVFQVP